MKTVFIDGSAGTTGLRIYERLQARQDIALMTLPDELRKDPAAKREALNSCDLAFLCLPDAAAMEDVQLVENPDTIGRLSTELLLGLLADMESGELRRELEGTIRAELRRRK